MLNSLKDIKRLWPGEVLNFDDESIIDDDKTEYELFLEKEGVKIARRLSSWAGAEAYEDALLPAPAVPLRADALKEAEIELFHVNLMEKLWRDKSAGAERDIQLPSGMRVTLQAFSSEDYESIIEAHLLSAHRAVMEYLV